MELILLTCILVAGFPLATPQNYRLPENVVPSKYIVDLSVPKGVFTGINDTFEGQVTIHFKVINSTSQIKLHHRVDIISAELKSGAKALQISSETYDNITEIYTIETASLVPGNEYVLAIKYSGIFEAKLMKGFYISSYKDENNKIAYLVTTQFEPTHARHAFPCFDEPQFKAKFTISLTFPTGLNALANTVIENSTALDNGYTKVTYKETPTMSTYLVAFIISSFTCSEGDSIDSTVAHAVCSRKESEADRAWAVEIGTPLIRTLESMLGIKYGYSMPKMDQVAIPDFSAGAMENWGLVTYRETGLLFNEEDTSNNYKKSIALVIAHEFTHMWFGNLVTCKWWDYTFLNEGFARFYQYFAAAATKQFIDWELEKHFNVEQVQTALLADSTSSAIALTSTCASPSEISDKFGTISYNKGASILRMIETNIMGPDNFIYGLRHYLDTYKFQGAVPSDLWTCLAKFVPSSNLPSGVTLSTALHNWVDHSGHPVVSVARSGDDVVLTQKRFLLAGNATTQYYVPITYTVSSDVTKFANKTVKAWLTPNQSLTLSGVLKGSDWIILNNRQSGFYRVDYDKELWSAIKSQLHSNHLAIDVLNRAQLVSDVYNYARSGQNGGYGDWTYTQTMSVLSYLAHEVDYYPWYAAIVGNNHLLQRIGYESEEGKWFTSWMLKLMSNVYSTVQFENVDSSNQVYTMKQILILAKVCKYGEESCIRKSKELFANYRTKGVKVPKNLRPTVYCTALKHSDDIATDFKFLWGKYEETKLMSEVLTILSGLGCTEDATLLKWFLGQTINATSGIRLQDFTSVWSYVYSSGQVGTDAALEYISENYAELADAYDGVGSLISSISNYVCHESQLEKLKTLVNLADISDGHKKNAEKALKTANETIIWAATLKKDVNAYLAASGASEGSAISRSSLVLAVIIVFLQKMI